MGSVSDQGRDTYAPEGASDIRWSGMKARPACAFDYAICIPARNEAQTIGPTLAAIEIAMRRVAKRGCVVVAINDTIDPTSEIVRSWAKRTGTACLAYEFDSPQHARTAPVTRKVALDIGCELAAGGSLLTTDADTLVEPHWIARNLAALEGGMDLVCGQIALDPAELAKLPARVHAVGAAEAEYFALTESLWRAWTGMHEPLHIRASGASLALAEATYRAVGGLPTPPFAEDKALCSKVRACGYVAGAIDMPDTISSARLWGRAANGCGHALRQRMQEPNPPCDELLLPLGTLRDVARECRKRAVSSVSYADYLAMLERQPRSARLRYRDVLRELDAYRLQAVAYDPATALLSR